jgi:phosphoribosyl 1,2-cyclic phosphodiesterase
MFNFTPLASSSEGCCYLVESGTQLPLLIDAGIRFKDIQIGTDFKTSMIAGCLISHAHGDHSKAVKDLLKTGVDCYSARETWASLGIAENHRAKTITAGTREFFDGWTIMPFAAVHDVPGTLGFVIGDQAGNRLLYLTDSAYSLNTFAGLTHIAIECNYSEEILERNNARGDIDNNRFKRTFRTHMSLERLEDMLKANDLSKLQEIHLLHLSDGNGDEAKFKDRIQKLTGVPVYIAQKRGQK